MGDSQFSASELRKRYHRGGTVNDDELSSAQLRAKYAIPANRKDFSTNEDDRTNRKSNSTMLVAATVAILVLLAIAAYFILSNKQ
mgnify:CR=1 FL=1